MAEVPLTRAVAAAWNELRRRWRRHAMSKTLIEAI